MNHPDQSQGSEEKAEAILKAKFGGYIGETKVYITDKGLLIEAMNEYSESLRSELSKKDQIIADLKSAMIRGTELYAHLRFDDEPFTPYQLALQDVEKKDEEIKQLKEALSRVSECNDLATAREYARDPLK
jgi:hypothetical protein